MGATMSESIVMTETVTAQILEQVYQAGALRLALLAHGAKDVVHVQRASAPDWIVRIYPVSDPAPPHDRVTALAQLLVFLEQHQYPAERVVRTIDGKLTSRIDACHVLVTTYLGSPLQVWQPVEADRVISIAPFRGEAGCPYPVYVDVASGRIGALFPTSATTFVAGPVFLRPFPPELHVTFVSDNERNVIGLRWRQHEGVEQWAPKTLLKHEDVSFQNDTVTLAGTLTTPASTGSHPAIVLIHGSGDQRRDHAFLQFIADLFALHGIAVLAYDKRGVGASTGDSDTAMLADLAGDALAGVAFLQTRPDITPHQIGLWGISQGGWIAPLAAAQSRNVAFIILVSGPAVSVVQQDVDRVAYELRAGGFSEDEVRAAITHEQLFSDVAFTGQGWDKLEASIQHARATRWASIVALPSQDEFERYGSLWGQFRAYDPIPQLQQVTCPVLALFGGRDTVVPPAKNAPLLERALKAGGNRDYTITVFPDGDHVIMATPTGARRDVPLWTQFVPGYFATMLDWLRARVNTAG